MKPWKNLLATSRVTTDELPCLGHLDLLADLFELLVALFKSVLTRSKPW